MAARVTYARPGLLGGEIGEPASWLLAIAAMAFALGGTKLLSVNPLENPVIGGVFIGFVLHELAHREVAKRYGATASFVATPLGLLITFASGLMPIAILAPGYVKVTAWGYVNPRGMFYSVAAGPATNVVLALLLYAGSTAVAAPGPQYYLAAAAKINAYIALFNLIPIDPLDGAKIVRASPAAWAALVAAALALYIAI